MTQRIWVIELRDGAGPTVWRGKAPYGRYSEDQMVQLLQLLVSKAGLNFDEIFSATGRKSARRANLLEVHRSADPYSLSCGWGWHAIARVALEESP